MFTIIIMKIKTCVIFISVFLFVSSFPVLVQADTLQWSRTYNRDWPIDVPQSIIKVRDGGFIVVGEADEMSGSSILLLKTDKAGLLKWTFSWGGDFHIYSRPECIYQEEDGSYTILGHTVSTPHGWYSTHNLMIWKISEDRLDNYDDNFIWTYGENYDENVDEYEFNYGDVVYRITKDNFQCYKENILLWEIDRSGQKRLETEEGYLLLDEIRNEDEFTLTNLVAIRLRYFLNTYDVTPQDDVTVLPETEEKESRLVPNFSPMEIDHLKSIANKNSRFFSSLSSFIENRIDPTVYLDDIAQEWEELGDKLLLKPEDFPLTLFLTIFKADQVKAVGDINEGILASVTALSETTFWFEFWMNEGLSDDIKALCNRFDELATHYDWEVEFWQTYVPSKIDGYERILEEEQILLSSLINELNIRMPSILNHFEVSAYDPIVFEREVIGEGLTRKFEVVIERAPEFLEVETFTADNSGLWSMFLTKPNFEITVQAEKLGKWTSMNKVTVGRGYSSLWAMVDIYLGFHGHWDLTIDIVAKDLGGDNWLTFWVDEGKKESEFDLSVKYGRETTSYKDIYAFQARGLEDFKTIMNQYCDFLKTTCIKKIELFN